MLEKEPSAKAVKDFYSHHHDTIHLKRHESPYWLRRYAHRRIHSQFLPYLRPGDSILDAGCGDGMLTRLIASHGYRVIGVDISAPNTLAATHLTTTAASSPLFVQADLERLPFPNGKFDVVVSSHVIEHLPDPIQSLKEIGRVTKNRALIAMPTCLNPASWTLLGGDNYWKLGRRFAIATPKGLFKTMTALARNTDGPDEGYAGVQELPHVWRFPWKLKSLIEGAGFEVRGIEAGPLIAPYVLQYLAFLRWVQPLVDHFARWPIIRYLGYGTLLDCRFPRRSSQ